MNKKLLALLLAILMVAVSACAMADDDNNKNIVDQAIPIVKTFTGDHGTETVSFTVTPGAHPNGVTDVPALSASDITITGEGTENGSISISASSFTVPGDYYYEIAETAGTTPGVTYDTTKYQLKVQAYLDESGDMHVSSTLWKMTKGSNGAYETASVKSPNASFNNVFTPDSTGLTVTKVLDGNFADTRDYFTIVVKIAKSDAQGNAVTSTPVVKLDNVVQSITPTEETISDVKYFVYTFTNLIKDGSTINVTNVPTGITWKVSETLTNGKAVGSVSGKEYDSTIDVAEGVFGTNTSCQVTNTRQQDLDTGVNTDNTPYILLMALVAIMALAFVAKKRSVRE